MKRCLITVVVGMLLTLAASGTATAGGGGSLLGSAQQGEQSADFGDQSVGKQQNDADVSQSQGNGNLNISPAISVFGDAKSQNAQGNGNQASADVDQSNAASQSQSAEQGQALSQSGGGCCGGQSQTGEQSAEFGDQHVGEQRNDADVSQEQGNGNVNRSPAGSFFGDAETKNAQGNGNEASADVDQSNKATQRQSAEQGQFMSQKGGCCSSGKPKHDSDRKGHEPDRKGDKLYGRPKHDVDRKRDDSDGKPEHESDRKRDDWNGKPKHGDDEEKRSCCHDQRQHGKQSADFGDQHVGEQRNDADVTQKQGNDNVNESKPELDRQPSSSCSKERGKCGGHPGKGGSDASSWNAQGNGNEADASVTQSNAASQKQSAQQGQWLGQFAGSCREVIGG